MGATSRVTRILLAACLASTAAAVGLLQASADQQIVGGQRASIADYSFAVYLATPDGHQFCGGTLVAANKVITAAHCVAGRTPADLTVVAGREDKESAAGVVAPVREIWVHPKFTNVRSGSDVALLTLETRLPYRTVPLVDANEAEVYQAGQQGVILGWGRTAAGGQPSRYLLRATVPVMADAECVKSYPSYLAAAMTCAGVPQGGIDTCQGDSGGPFIVAGRLVGVTSWGEGCAAPGKPGVYTRLLTYAALLEEQI